MVKEILVSLLFNVVRLLASIVFSVGALYTGLKFIDGLTKGLNEWEEIKKGNLAVGLFVSSILLALLIMLQPAIDLVVLTIGTNPLSFIIGFLNYFFDFLLAVVVIYLTVHLLDKMTVGLDEFVELKKGNIAVALMISVVLLTVAVVARNVLSYGFNVGTMLTQLGVLSALCL